MTTNKLIIFKKDTDAPRSNRGFIYQYLKTLLRWLNNYKNKQSVTIYCEVNDDIKEINLIEQTVRFTQLKCYSTALNIDSNEVKNLCIIIFFYILFTIAMNVNICLRQTHIL